MWYRYLTGVPINLQSPLRILQNARSSHPKQEEDPQVSKSCPVQLRVEFEQGHRMRKRWPRSKTTSTGTASVAFQIWEFSNIRGPHIDPNYLDWYYEDTHKKNSQFTGTSSMWIPASAPEVYGFKVIRGHVSWRLTCSFVSSV